MKDSKRIDNKAKSRRIAAYALAGCMAVTAAPMTMPGMGPEIVKADSTKLEITEIKELDAGTYKLGLTNKVKNSTTYAEIANKLAVTASATSGTDDGAPVEDGGHDLKVATWASKAATVSIYDKSNNLLWNSKGDTSAPGTTKLGYGKTYKIVAEFSRSVKYKTGDNKTTASVATNDSGNVTMTGLSADQDEVTVTISNVVFYPSDGMFKNEAEGSGHFLYVDKNGSQQDKTGVYKNEEGWFLVVNGTTLTTPARVDTSTANKITETIEKNANGSWYIGTDGKVDFTKTGIVQAVQGTRTSCPTGETNTGLPLEKYYVENGKVNYNKTGLVKYDGKYYKVVKGVVETGKEDVCKVSNMNWVYIDTSGVSDNFSGIAKNKNGLWYLDEGKVDFSKEGPIYVDGNMEEVANPMDASDIYFVIGGKVQQDTTGVVFYDGEAFYLTKGLVTNANLEERTLAKDTKTGNWYAIGTDGSIDDTFWGLVENQYGTWYVRGGKVDFTRTGIVREDALDPSSDQYYVEGGKVQKNKNGIVLENGQAFNVVNGKLEGLDINKSVVKAPNKIWYVLDKDGKQATSVQIAANSNGIWICDYTGTVDFDARGFHQVTEDESKINGLKEGDLVYFKDGKAQTDLTGFVKLEKLQFGDTGNTANGETVYLKNGVYSTEVDVTEPTVIKGADGKWYYADEDGIDFDKTGVATNKYGTWFVEDGRVKFNMTGFYKDTTTDKTYYFVDSKLATDKTGAIKDALYGSAAVPVHYVEKGVVTGKKSGDNVLKANDGAWYYIDEDGNNATDVEIATNKNGSWFIKNGKVDFTKDGVVTITKSGTDDYAVGDKLYVLDGKVQTNYTGFVVDASGSHYFKNGKYDDNAKAELVEGTDGKTYYVENGTVKVSYTGLAKNDKGVWYVKDGVVTTGKTGIVSTPDVEDAKLDAGKYYVVNGKMTGDKSGIFKDESGDQYYVEKSAVVLGTKADESVIKVDGTWYCINDEGKVSTPRDGLAANKNGIWFIKDGKVDFTKTGLVEIKNTEVTDLQKIGDNEVIYISGGKFQNDVTAVYANKNEDKKYIKDGVVTKNDTSYYVTTVVKGTDGKSYAVRPAAQNNEVVTGNGLAKTKDNDVVYVKNGVVDNSVSQMIRIATTDALDLAVIGINTIPANPVDVAIVSGKFASDKTGFINIKGVGGTYDKVYVDRGIGTKPASGNIIEDRDTKILYYVGNGYTVVRNTTPLLATYGSQKYYVLEGQVRTSSIKNYFNINGDAVCPADNMLYTIAKGVATVSTASTSGTNRVVECSDGVTRVIGDTGALVSASSTLTKQTYAGADWVVKDGIVQTGDGNRIIALADTSEVAVDADGKVITNTSVGNYLVTLSNSKKVVVNEGGVWQKTPTTISIDGNSVTIGADGYVTP